MHLLELTGACWHRHDALHVSEVSDRALDSSVAGACLGRELAVGEPLVSVLKDEVDQPRCRCKLSHRWGDYRHSIFLLRCVRV